MEDHGLLEYQQSFLSAMAENLEDPFESEKIVGLIENFELKVNVYSSNQTFSYGGERKRIEKPQKPQKKLCGIKKI